MVENTPGHLPEQSTKVIKAVAFRNDGFYSEWYSWFTAYQEGVTLQYGFLNRQGSDDCDRDVDDRTDQIG